MRIYLIGYMASGKSNFGQLLAEKLGFAFLDLDYMFEQRFRISVLDFFSKYDEASFRKIEQSLLHATLDHDDVVIATGGGTPCFYDNMQFIKKSGLSIYLYWEISKLIERLRHVKLKRPLLEVIPPAEFEERVSLHIDLRKSYYEQADITVDGANLNLDRIIGLIRSSSESP